MRIIKRNITLMLLIALGSTTTLGADAVAGSLYVCLTEQAIDMYAGTSHAPTPYASMMKAGKALNKFFAADCATIKKAYTAGKITAGLEFSKQMSTAKKPETIAGVKVTRLFLGTICGGKQPLYQEANAMLVGMGTTCEPYTPPPSNGIVSHVRKLPPKVKRMTTGRR